MIIVQLMGGLGNQMFQYAAGRALAARHNTQLVFDSSWIDGEPGVGESRRYELGCFALNAPLVHVQDVARLPSRSHGRAQLRGLLPRGRKPLVHELKEPRKQTHEPAILTAPDDTYLRGYWQRELYFESAEALIRAEFHFRDPLDERSQAFAAAIRGAPSAASLHVRRGDYVSAERVRERLGPLDPGYYRRAVDIVADRVGSVQLFVCSDDPDWCRTTLRLEHETTVVEGNAENGWRDMQLMSLCDHHVVANSSFSWWGAWLNPAPDKVVIAPRPWFRDPRWSDEQRTPPGWIRIDRHDAS